MQNLFPFLCRLQFCGAAERMETSAESRGLWGSGGFCGREWSPLDCRVIGVGGIGGEGGWLILFFGSVIGYLDLW